jgi:hypothetical protein
MIIYSILFSLLYQLYSLIRLADTILPNVSTSSIPHEGGCYPVLFENVPEGRFKITIPGQEIFEKLNAEKFDGLLE